jgi:hypothetical protein
MDYSPIALTTFHSSSQWFILSCLASSYFLSFKYSFVTESSHIPRYFHSCLLHKVTYFSNYHSYLSVRRFISRTIAFLHSLSHCNLNFSLTFLLTLIILCTSWHCSHTLAYSAKELNCFQIDYRINTSLYHKVEAKFFTRHLASSTYPSLIKDYSRL